MSSLSESRPSSPTATLEKFQEAGGPEGSVHGGVGSLPEAASLAGSVLAGESIEKIVLAIHGIGDQTQFDTLRPVVARFGAYANYSAANVPLGSFHAPGGTVRAFVLPGPPPPGELKKIGFAEIYWADIAREVEKKGFILEETKKWARTIVDRVRVHSMQKGELKNKDYTRAGAILSEMTDTVQVLQNLLYLAEKAGLLKFNLNRLLRDYLGDVQIVTEFSDYRASILKKFREVIEALFAANPKAELYLVAHSEGTVIAFMGLLQAIKESPNPNWLRNVHGLMTIGSPIDKHLLLWHNLWDPFQDPVCQPPQGQIKWRNYYDFGDPIGFDLTTARIWMMEHGVHAFEFTDKDDFGFSRYLLPGEAHNGYWEDDAVFGHFIQTVVDRPPSLRTTTPPKGGSTGKPSTKPWVAACSYVLPYVLFAALLFLAVYVLYKAGDIYVGLTGAQSASHGVPSFLNVVTDLLAMTSLLAGVTLLARLPQLVRGRRWWFCALGCFVVSTTIYGILASDKVCEQIGFCWGGILPPRPGSVGSAFLVGAGACFLGRWCPRWRMRPLLVLGTLFASVVLVHRIFGAVGGWEGFSKPVWPLVMAGLAFLYLWWLAALFFDLVFVWHLYIRFSLVQGVLAELRRKRKQAAGLEPSRLEGNKRVYFAEKNGRNGAG